tara:strand:+ start:4630 stop:5088 length:459 start_codon:yes stop_codon:yes gene_type:complete
MASSTKFRGAIRSGPNAAVGDVMLMQRSDLNIALTVAAELFTLPQGSVIEDVVLFMCSSAQTDVTVDLGTSTTVDNLAAEWIVGTDNQDASLDHGHQSARNSQVLGALVTATPLAAATTFYGLAGATAGTGTATVGVRYYIDPDNAREPSAE